MNILKLLPFYDVWQLSMKIHKDNIEIYSILREINEKNMIEARETLRNLL